MKDKRDECGCHHGCIGALNGCGCVTPCRWPECLTDAEHTALVEEIVLDELTDTYRALVDRATDEALGDLANWHPTGIITALVTSPTAAGEPTMPAKDTQYIGTAPSTLRVEHRVDGDVRFRVLTLGGPEAVVDLPSNVVDHLVTDLRDRGDR